MSIKQKKMKTIIFEILSDSKAKYINKKKDKKINRDFLYFTASNMEEIEKQPEKCHCRGETLVEAK